ncbi:MAG: sigma-54-dependent Fis family transcriptional regulator [Methylococcaceae bacterium]|nr:sigma-54-dependent Fis family transcriptional regulator [Methylococcaceae bacterium]
MTNARVLVVDDEPNGRRPLELLLQDLGCEVACAEHGRQALERLAQQPADLVITDLNMPQMNGLELLAALRAEHNDVPVVVVTAFGTVETAVAAMKSGAIDYLVRPLDLDRTELVIRRALERQRMVRENLYLRDELARGWDDFVGHSDLMQELYDLIRQVGPSTASVLIVGETGTGKELAARAIHRSSGRTGLFVAINCAAIPADILESELFGHVRGAFTGANRDKPGKFELAHEGTLFLDEITEMSQPLQAKLLRVLQENTVDRLGSTRPTPIDIRVVAATNRQPQTAVADGLLRQDLYYRLNVVSLQLPPLRDRRDDIPLLASHFIDKYAARLGKPKPRLDPAAQQALLAYPWPGNVRELENVMERAVVLSRSDRIDASQLPAELNQPSAPLTATSPATEENLDLEQRVTELETRLIALALQQAGDNKAKASRLLNISERTLWYKLKKYEI